MSTGSSSSGAGNTSVNDNSHSSGTILLHAGSRVVLTAPQLAISHDAEGNIGLEDEEGASSPRFATAAGNFRSGGEYDSQKKGSGRGGGGLWSAGSALTGRAEQRVLLQAGLRQPPTGDK